MSDTKKRWQYRFDNFKRTHARLSAAVERYNNGELSGISKVGTIRIYNRCWELAWKMMKDYLAEQKISPPIIAPEFVIREAAAVKFITDGESWMEATKAHSEMDDDIILDDEKIEAALKTISKTHRHCFIPLHEKLEKQYDKNTAPPNCGVNRSNFDHGLSERSLAIIKKILSETTPDIERVCLFGSRATGLMNPIPT